MVQAWFACKFVGRILFSRAPPVFCSHSKTILERAFAQSHHRAITSLRLRIEECLGKILSVGLSVGIIFWLNVGSQKHGTRRLRSDLKMTPEGPEKTRAGTGKVAQQLTLGARHAELFQAPPSTT